MEQPNLTIFRSRRKTISIAIERDLRVVVRVPLQMSELEIQQFLADREPWLQRHLEQERQRQQEQAPPLTSGELDALMQQARQILPERTGYFAPQVGVTYGWITIRHQISRWGSCSAKGNLNFNCLLMLCPPEVADYVVVHELCHRLEMNHSPRFWAEVVRVLPDYKKQRRWLKEHEMQLIGRLRGNE